MSSLRRSALAALALTVLSLPSLAAADGAYAGLGVGPGASLGGDYGVAFSNDGFLAARLHGGYRMGPWGFEASYFGTGMERKNGGDDYSITAVGIGAKYHLTFDRGIELYIRLGLNRTSLNAPEQFGQPGTWHDFSGTGIDYGTGVSWRSQPMGAGRIRPRVGGFLDLGVHRVTIGRDNIDREFAGSMKTVQVGVISSIDF